MDPLGPPTAPRYRVVDPSEAPPPSRRVLDDLTLTEASDDPVADLCEVAVERALEDSLVYRVAYEEAIRALRLRVSAPMRATIRGHVRRQVENRFKEETDGTR